MSLENRPLSPHISIYKPQITSVLSISHRITGVVLYFGIVFLIWTLFAAVYTQKGEDLLFMILGSYPGIIILFAWSFCLFYHLLNGIRHLFWDIGKGYELAIVTKSGIAVVIGAVLLTIGCWILVI